MKSSEISELTGLSKLTVLQHHKKLKDLDLNNKTGSGAHTKYKIVR